MALTNQVLMPGADYQAICNKVRELTGGTAPLKSGDIVTALSGVLPGGGGEQPQLHAPSITVSGTVLNIENPAGNGDFVSSFGGYLNGSHFGDTQAISVDLSSRDLIPDTANIQVTAKGEKFIESEKSNNIFLQFLFVIENKNLK